MSKFILSAFADEAGQTMEEQIAALERNNIRFIEIRNVNGINICDTPPETVREYKNRLDEAAIGVISVGSRIGKVRMNDNWDEHMAVFLNTLTAADILGAKKMRMFSVFTDAQPENCRDVIFDRLEQMINLAADAGITLCHENEKDIYGDIGNRVLELVERYKGRMSFIFDPANFVQCGCDPMATYLSLRDSIDYFHIKDCYKETGIVAAAGEGDCDIEKMLADFAEDHDDTMLTVEPHLAQFVGLKDRVSIHQGGPARFASNNEAFDYAVNALKRILDKGELNYV